MTMIIDHAPQRPATGFASFAGSITGYFRKTRQSRRVNREHAMLMAMSNHQLKDIGMTRGAVSFGISSGRGVFREMNR